MSTTWLILQLRNDNHLTKPLLTFEKTKGSLISETFSLFKSAEHPTRKEKMLRGVIWHLFFWDLSQIEILAENKSLLKVLSFELWYCLTYTTIPIWRYHSCYWKFSYYIKTFATLKNPIVFKISELYKLAQIKIFATLKKDLPSIAVCFQSSLLRYVSRNVYCVVHWMAFVVKNCGISGPQEGLRI